MENAQITHSDGICFEIFMGQRIKIKPHASLDFFKIDWWETTSFSLNGLNMECKNKHVLNLTYHQYRINVSLQSFFRNWSLFYSIPSILQDLLKPQDKKLGFSNNTYFKKLCLYFLFFFYYYYFLIFKVSFMFLMVWWMKVALKISKWKKCVCVLFRLLNYFYSSYDGIVEKVPHEERSPSFFPTY